MSQVAIIIVVFCICLQYAFKDRTYSTDVLWGNYTRPGWSKSVIFTIDGTSNQTKALEAYIIPISSRGRGNTPLPYNSDLSLSNKERGYLLSPSNGGPDIEYNVIPQPNEWKTKGGWAELQAIIHNFTVYTYSWYANYNDTWDACMCPGAYTVETVFNSSPPPQDIPPVHITIRVDTWGPNKYPLLYEGLLNNTYHFNITVNGTVYWHPEPPSYIRPCKRPLSSRCCDRWNCCGQKQIQQIWSPTIFYESDYLESSNGLYQMTLEETGDFSIYNESNTIIWKSNTGNGTEYHPYKLLILENGSLILKNNVNSTVWTSKACDQLDTPFRFIMEDNGNLALYSLGNRPCWSTNTSINTSFDNKQDFICSSNLLINKGVSNTSYVLNNDSCIAEILMNGEFVIKDLTMNSSHNVVWTTNTANKAAPPYTLSVQMDGRMILSGNYKNTWIINSSDSFNVATMQNFMLTLQRDEKGCILTWYRNNMSVIWSSSQ